MLSKPAPVAQQHAPHTPSRYTYNYTHRDNGSTTERATRAEKERTNRTLQQTEDSKYKAEHTDEHRIEVSTSTLSQQKRKHTSHGTREELAIDVAESCPDIHVLLAQCNAVAHVQHRLHLRDVCASKVSVTLDVTPQHGLVSLHRHTARMKGTSRTTLGYGGYPFRATLGNIVHTHMQHATPHLTYTNSPNNVAHHTHAHPTAPPHTHTHAPHPHRHTGTHTPTHLFEHRQVGAVGVAVEEVLHAHDLVAETRHSAVAEGHAQRTRLLLVAQQPRYLHTHPCTHHTHTHDTHAQHKRIHTRIANTHTHTSHAYAYLHTYAHHTLTLRT